MDNVDEPPTAGIVNPAGREHRLREVTIQVDATDDRDAEGTLTVEISVDGGLWQAVTYNSGSGYYEMSWDTTTETDDLHTIDARATDSGANTTYANQVTVTVEQRGHPAQREHRQSNRWQYRTGMVVIQVDADDVGQIGTSTVQVSIDSGIWQAATYNGISGYYESDLGHHGGRPTAAIP